MSSNELIIVRAWRGAGAEFYFLLIAPPALASLIPFRHDNVLDSVFSDAAGRAGRVQRVLARYAGAALAHKIATGFAAYAPLAIKRGVCFSFHIFDTLATSPMQTFSESLPPLPAEHVADANITAAIELFFLTKKGVSSHLMDVVTQEGIVRLDGIADNLLARERAEEIALAVRGVRGVINELVISTPDVPDNELLHHVARALDDDPATGGYNVQCAAEDGVVALTGAVQSWAEKGLVLRVVRGVRGVRRIVADELIIHWGHVHNSDGEITTQIRELLDWDIRVYSSLVEVDTVDQMTHLAGTVATAAEKAHVVATAYQAGARHVDARELEVSHLALGREMRQEKYAPRTDAAIAQAVLDTLRFDPRVRSYQPLVLVHNGIVTLTGAVSNLLAKQDAERDARHVVGVWDVHNLLKVRTHRFIPDANVCQTIKEALARDPYVGFFEFSVRVHNGKAQLYGHVNSRFEQEQAGGVAAGVNGVAEVDNWVSVPGNHEFDGFQAYAWSAATKRSAGPNPDFALAERIRQRCFWSASLHNQNVEVLVEKGRATLTGTVDTWLDREQATLEAYDAGARDVDNNLLVARAAGL